MGEWEGAPIDRHDLVQRLRGVADRWGSGPLHADLIEAADEIEQLRILALDYEKNAGICLRCGVEIEQPEKRTGDQS